ncbi:MAG: hypothetical protein QM601_06045 [Pseudoxanthomonas sp.]
MSKPHTHPAEAPDHEDFEADPAYWNFLREAVLEARRDPRPPMSSAEAKARMDAFKAELRAKAEAHFGKIEWE